MKTHDFDFDKISQSYRHSCKESVRIYNKKNNSYEFRIYHVPLIWFYQKALTFTRKLMPVLDHLLKKESYISGDSISIADLFAFAYIEQADDIGLSLSPYPEIKKWSDTIKKRNSIQISRQKIKKYV
ncbi:MAG: glutathione S-transferase family protein [Deltaproteobacteria bacterium]|nr:glutathione S-transferase family protein [Deltaproteobacteria bacterium]